jgi:hypothetical protein
MSQPMQGRFGFIAARSIGNGDLRDLIAPQTGSGIEALGVAHRTIVLEDWRSGGSSEGVKSTLAAQSVEIEPGNIFAQCDFGIFLSGRSLLFVRQPNRATYFMGNHSDAIGRHRRCAWHVVDDVDHHGSIAVRQKSAIGHEMTNELFGRRRQISALDDEQRLIFAVPIGFSSRRLLVVS